MKNKIFKLTKQPFVRNVIILSSGTAGAQVIAMLLSPVITRLYGPEAYGVMGTFAAIISIITPIAAFTFPVAIVLPKLDSEAKGLIRLSLFISTLLSMTIGILLFLFHKQMVSIFNLEEISAYLFLIPVVVFSAGFLQVIEQWLIRNKQFTVSAYSVLIQSIVVSGSKVVVGFFYPIATVLVFITAFNQGFKALLMNFLTMKSDYKLSFQKISKKVSYKGLFKKYKDFPIFRAPEVFINGISENLPIILLTSLFGPASAGFYSICKTVLNAPSNLIGKSVGNVFYPRITEAANNDENLTKLIKKATYALGAVGILPYGIVVIFGPELFSIVFGENWTAAGEYARWIALLSFFGFINKPCVKALPVLKAQKFQLMYTIFSLIIKVILIAIGFYVFTSDYIAVALFSISGAMLHLGLILITIRLSMRFDRDHKI
ncbi:lipopolysaccharide biosynthesis protein [Sutcliffiella horikoshii]|uniref:lipopolysaccharide biosynthesis protein n=1 Tax=Sutcliffiella horikoshii TaxID=79883 RepID=UPI00384D4B3A